MRIDRRNFLAGVASASALYAQGEKPIRLGIVGTGNRGRAHIVAIKALPQQFQIVALADPTPGSLDLAATLVPGAKTYSDYQKMLAEQKDLDAVIVITPSFLHADITVAALNHSLHVLCEKPIATRIEDANRMIDAAKKSGKLLYIGFQKRFVPAHAKLHELAAAGAIGKIEFISANLFRGDWNPLSWKYTDPKTGVATNWRYLTHTQGSALLEDGIHEMDILNWIVNDRVAYVTATGGNNVFKQRETIDHAAMMVEYESGMLEAAGEDTKMADHLSPIFRPAFPSSAIISERSSPSRVRFAAPNNGAPRSASFFLTSAANSVRGKCWSS